MGYFKKYIHIFLNVKFNKFILIPLLCSLVLMAIYYPGFMSYDSLRMLEEARTSVRGGFYPTFPVYILRFFDLTGNGVSFMIFTQNFILLLGLTLIILKLGFKLTYLVLIILNLLLMPTILGSMLVLWKDVTLTALLVFSVALIFISDTLDEKSKILWFVKWISLALIFMATFVRFNSLTSTIVVVFYWLIVFLKKRNYVARGVIFSAICISLLSGNYFINNYKFNNLEKLEPNHLMYAIMAYDLVGISKYSRVSLIPFSSSSQQNHDKTSIVNIDKIYSSLGAEVMKVNNSKLGEIVQIFPEKYENTDIVSAWIYAVAHYPIAYLEYRWDLFSEIIGAKSHRTYAPTHFAKIDENSFGIKFNDRFITNLTLKYIYSASKYWLWKPWFLFLLSFACFLHIVRIKNISPERKRLSICSFIASVCYVSPFFVLSGTGEVRYSFPAIVLSSIVIMISISEHYFVKNSR